MKPNLYFNTSHVKVYPEGATETNADGTVNLYDAAGNITGSVTKEEAEKMAAEVTKIVDEEGNALADLK